VGFTDTSTGNLAFHVGDDPIKVAANRAGLDAFLSAPGCGPVQLQYMNQVHGRDVAAITSAQGSGRAPTADAMVSRGAALAVMVADCVPVVLVGDTADGSPVLAVAHAGRPGVQHGVIDATVRHMRAEGALSIEAWLGPSVCGRCYEVPAQLREAVAAVVPEAYATTSWGTPSLDLPAAVRAQLAAHSVTIHTPGPCTLEHPEFFSHRRAVRDGEAEGRLIGFVAAPQPLDPATEGTHA